MTPQNKKALLIGCGSLVLLGLLGVVALILFLAHASKDLEKTTITVTCPAEVAVGDTLNLEVLVKNDRPDTPLDLSDVDVGEDYLAGFVVVSTTPAPKSSMHVPVDNSRSFTFDTPIPAGTDQKFIFTLLAKKAGIFRGDVDVCEGVQFITGIAETIVKEKE